MSTPETKLQGSNEPPVERIHQAALAILRSQGVSALTTRAVCERAAVTAPTLYHHYGGKDGLLLKLAQREMQAFFERKRKVPVTQDPLADVKRGWDDWVAFASENLPLVAAIESSMTTRTHMRQIAQAIVIERLLRLQVHQPIAMPAEQAARLLVMGANAVVALLLEGDSQASALSPSLRDAVFDVACGIPSR